MAAYAITHRTTYSYTEPVSICHNLAYLMPRRAANHLWSDCQIIIDPKPSLTVERPDYFGNVALYFAIQEPHNALIVTARSHVEVTPLAPTDAPVPMAWEEAQKLLRQAPDEALLDAYQFTLYSPFTLWPESLAEYAQPSFPPGRGLSDAVLDLTRRIHADFTYDSKATSVSTTIAELLRHRRGVCQDLAHLQIACLRCLGLAARYVSGYLLATPPPGRPRLVGADASHAWVSVFLPGLGWLDVDPTNNMLPSDQHITIAWGRDYGDVSPLRGVILGGGEHRIEVSVDVQPLPGN
jgi:transglutaminase-like putative cysteine protease